MCRFVDEWRKIVVAAAAQQTARGVRLYDFRTGEERTSLDAKPDGRA